MKSNHFFIAAAFLRIGLGCVILGSKRNHWRDGCEYHHLYDPAGGKPMEELKTVPWAANASVTKVVFDGQSFSLAEYSRDDFMGNLVTRLAKGV